MKLKHLFIALTAMLWSFSLTANAQVAKIGETTYEKLQAALEAAAAGTGNVTVEILADVDLTGSDWNPVTVSGPGYPVVTVEGNDKTITGLNDMLFAGTWAGKSGLIIKNLTIDNAAIVNDKDDAKGNVGVGAFIGYPQASATITLEDCHLTNSSVEGGHWTGGLIGMAGGYNGNDGPVFMNLTITGCSVTGSTITGKGSVGGIIGHGSCSAWTNVVIEETTVSDNIITSTGSSTVKAGAVMGTIGAAGQSTTVNGETKTGGATVSATVAGNTVTSNGTAITTIYGRQGTETGMLYVAGGSYDNYPVEKNVAYAAPIEGYEIVKNADGTYGVKDFVAPVSGLTGEGTAASPYLINNVEELLWFQAKVDEQAADGSTQYAGKYIKLTADIDLAGINWNPIGSMTGDHGSFKGVFDGDNHTISNLNIEQAGNGLGLFAYTSGNAVIKNLKLNNVTVKSTNNSNYVGGVVGNAYASTKIENVHVTGDVHISGRGYIGGIAGHGYVVMDNVSVVANEGGLITSTFWCAGGVLGYAGEGTTNITNAHVEGLTVTSAAGGLGAIVGMAEDNNGTQPISGSNLSAKNVAIKTYVGSFGTSYADYALGYLYGGSETSKLTGDLVVENVTVETSSGVTPTIVDAVATVGDAVYFDFAAAAYAAAQAGDEIVMLADATVEGTLALPAGIKLTSNGHTINGSIRMLGDLTLNGPLTITGGLWVGKSGETLTATLSGDKLTAGYFMFQRGTYTINADIDAVYGYLSYEGTFEVNSTIHTTGANGEVLYINGNVTLNDGAVLDSDNSVFVCNDNAVLTLKPGSKVDSNVSITKSGAKLNIDATGMAAGATANITGTVTNSGNGTIAVVGNDKLEAKIVDGKIVLAAKPVAKIGDTYYATLAEAIAASTSSGWGAEVTLLKDITLEGGYADSDEGLRIEKSVTINGAGYTIDCGIFTKGIRIYQNGDIASNVMFKNINIVNNNYQGRCIDTRSGKINLMLNGGVNLTAHGTNSQPLTIGGSEAMTKVTISGGTIDAGTSGYGVICFVPVTNNITVQSNAVIKGLAALYLKEGVTNTSIKLSQATIIGTNKYAAASGDFGAIVIEGSKNGVRLEHSDAVVKAVAADGAEMAAQAAFLLRGNNNTVGYYNNANAKVVTEGGQAYWTLSDADVTGTKYERNGVEMLLEAETSGYQFITVEDALRYAKDGDTVKLLANAELDETYVNEKSLTLDLNGKTLSTAYVAGSTTNHLYAIQNNAELTITDSSDAKDGKISARGIFNYGAMTLTSGTINAIDGNGGYGVRNYAGATFTMNGGTIATTYEDGDVPGDGYDASPVRVDEGATFTMNDGVINNVSNFTVAIDNYGTTIINDGKATTVHTTLANSGTMTINGGEFTCNGLEDITAHALWAADGTTTINGGTFDGKDNYNGFNVDASEGAVVTITGGTFLPVHSGSLYGEGTITVSGGTFFDKVAKERCAKGFICQDNGNGTYGVFADPNYIEEFTIDDAEAKDYTYDSEKTVGTLTYRRTLVEDAWNPLYVPFALPMSMLIDNYDVAYYNDVHAFDDDNDGTYERTTIELIKVADPNKVLKASYPLIIRPKSADVKDLELELTDVTLSKAIENKINMKSASHDFEIMGTYTKRESLVYTESVTQYVLGRETATGLPKWITTTKSLNPYRLILTVTSRGNVDLPFQAISMRIVGEETEDGTTFIYDVEMDSEQTVNYIYDLQGRRVLEPQKGNLYIINGKKVVIK